MKNKTYKITVLSDLNSATSKILKTTVKLAKMIHGEIEIFNIRRPTDIVDVDNQLSAMRSINTEHSAIDKKLRKLIAPISKSEEIDIGYSFAFGNIKDEIGKYIEERRPDIIVLGRRKYKPLNLVGDGISEFVLNIFDGPILIASDEGTLKPGEKLSLGVLNGLIPSSNIEFAENLMTHVQKPIKSFKFIKNSGVSEPKKVSQDQEIIEYVFEHSDGTINGLPKYVLKNKVDLLFLGRENNATDDKTDFKMSDIGNIIAKSKVSVLVSGKRM